MVSRRVDVGILGATGMVGQQFIMQLANHPWFRIAWLGASERSEGKKYRDLAWRLSAPRPAEVDDMVVEAAAPGRAPRLMFSGLDSKVAGDIEREFASAGHFVVSNARNYRMEQFVPLLVPEVNPDHLALIPLQQQAKGWKGAIVTNPNCATVPLVMALAAARHFEPARVTISTMQAVSGAGYPGRAVARHPWQSDSVHRRRRRKNSDRVAEDHGDAADRSRRAASDGRQRADDARAGDQRAHRDHQRAVQQKAVARGLEGGIPLVYRQAAAASTARLRPGSRCRSWTS